MAAPQEGTYAGRGLFRSDPDVGHTLRPGYASSGIETNTWGFRGREFPPRKPAGGFRILGLGDSFTFGRRSPDEVYLELLERRLAGAALPFAVEVLNAGVPGYDTRQEIAHLAKFGLRLSPDLVVLGLFVTGDVIENASGTFYAVVDGELTTVPLGRIERLLLRSHLYRFIRRRLTVHAAERAASGPDRARYLEVEWSRLQTCRRQPDRLSRRGFRATERLLLELRDLLRQKDVALVVLLIPDEVQVDARVFAEVLARFGGRAGDFDLDLPNRRLRGFLEAAGVEVLDILADLRQRHQAEPVYLPEDTHWSGAGHALAADRLAEALLPRLRARARAGRETTPTP